MNFLKKLLGKKELQKTEEHAVIVHFQYGSTYLQPIFDLGDKLDAALKSSGVGEYDGNEVATDGSDGFLYMYGRDANQIFSIVHAILKSEPFMDGASITLRFGPPQDGTKEEKITLGSKLN